MWINIWRNRVLVTCKWYRNLAIRGTATPNLKPLIVLFVLTVFVLPSCSLQSFQIKRAEALYERGQVLEAGGRPEEALSKFNDSMVLAEKAGFRPGVANNLNEIAIIYTSRGEYEKARELLVKALHIYREMNWKTEVSKTLNNIALTYLKELKFHEAIEAYGNLLDWDHKTGNRLGRVITQNNLGFIYGHYLNDPEKARKSYEEALRIARELGDRKYIKMLEEKLRE
jgi:tetratricopeptide (TPR) repeat protein